MNPRKRNQNVFATRHRSHTTSYPFGVIFRTSRKKPRSPSLSVRINTTDSYLHEEGGRSNNTIVRRANAEQGQTMAEYSIILALVALVAVAAYELLGGPVAALYERVVTTFT